jgi:hypothetical protein
MVRVYWGRKVGLTWDYCGKIEPWPEAGGGASVALTMSNGELVPIEACWENESTAQS